MLGAVAFALIDGVTAGDCSPSPAPSSSGSFQKKPGSPARSSLSAADGLLAGVSAAIGEGVTSLLERQGLIAGMELCACDRNESMQEKGLLAWLSGRSLTLNNHSSTAFSGSVLMLVVRSSQWRICWVSFPGAVW